MNKQCYPPLLSDLQLSSLITNIKDWQINHGSLLKLVRSEEENTVLARPIGVALFPSPLPRTLFFDSQDLCYAFNELYSAVSEHPEWLHDILRDVIAENELVSCLWDIHEIVQNEGYSQDVVLGLFRSDYMLHEMHSPEGQPKTVQLKQVEFNTYSCAGGVHANRLSDMHRYLGRTGIYASNGEMHDAAGQMPKNTTIQGLSQGLCCAHDLYQSQHNHNVRTNKAILFVVQPNNVNVTDERPIEYALSSMQPPIPAYRVVFGEEILSRCQLGTSKELFFTPVGFTHELEISVVYLRAGYDAEEYDEAGRSARLLLERSRAIKCPSILAHLATMKKVQQVLSQPYALNRFLRDRDQIELLSKTFMPMYPLLPNTDLGIKGLNLASQYQSAKSHILKPCLEGGGHNIHGEAIAEYLARVPQSSHCNYILMEKIKSPSCRNILMSPNDLYEGPVISELGIFGSCLWRRVDASGERNKKPEILQNSLAGWSLKTKSVDQQEMSVVKGFGCFDSPFLVDDAYFQEYTNQSDP